MEVFSRDILRRIFFSFYFLSFNSLFINIIIITLLGKPGISWIGKPVEESEAETENSITIHNWILPNQEQTFNFFLWAAFFK